MINEVSYEVSIDIEVSMFKQFCVNHSSSPSDSDP